MTVATVSLLTQLAVQLAGIVLVLKQPAQELWTARRQTFSREFIDVYLMKSQNLSHSVERFDYLFLFSKLKIDTYCTINLFTGI